MHTESPRTLSEAPNSLHEAETVYIPPPPTARTTRFEYIESGFEDRRLDADEAKELSQRIRKIYLKLFGKKGGMIL